MHELPDQQAAAASFCRSSHTLLDPDNLPELLARAFALFTSSRPGPVHIEIPLNLMEAPATVGAASDTQVFPPAPDPEAIKLAAQALDRAESPLIIVGGGARNASAELVRLAETADVPVLNTVNGKGVCPWGHPLAVGGSPSLPALRTAISNADLVLAIGTELAETDYDLLMAGALPDPQRWIRMDIDPQQLLIPDQPALAITTDAALGCAALSTALSSTANAAKHGPKTGAERAQSRTAGGGAPGDTLSPGHRKRSSPRCRVWLMS